jgi:hypothetical protein
MEKRPTIDEKERNCTGSFKTFWEGVSEKTTKDIKSN